MTRRCSFIVLAAGSAAFVTPAALGQTFQGLGHLPGGDRSVAASVSADGTVVVGTARTSSGANRAFRWTAEDGMQDLGVLLGSASSSATDVSADGAVVVGWSATSGGTRRGFRWTAGGMAALSHRTGWRESSATAVSADGSIVAGTIWNTDDYTHGVRWTGTAVLNEFGALPGSYWISVGDISADGSVVCGYNGIPFMDDEQAYRWLAPAGPAESISPGSDAQSASAISGDGAVIAGTTANREPFRWTETGGVELLPLPPIAVHGSVSALSQNGSVAAGRVGILTDTEAALWTPGGVLLVHEEIGEVVPAGWVLTSVTGVSADGRTIVGTGTNPAGLAEAWIATLPAACEADFNGDGALSLDDFVQFRNAYVAGDLRADFDGDGSLSLNDFVSFRNRYAAGCP